MWIYVYMNKYIDRDYSIDTYYHLGVSVCFVFIFTSRIAFRLASVFFFHDIVKIDKIRMIKFTVISICL